MTSATNISPKRDTRSSNVDIQKWDKLNGNTKKNMNMNKI